MIGVIPFLRKSRYERRSHVSKFPGPPRPKPWGCRDLPGWRAASTEALAGSASSGLDFCTVHLRPRPGRGRSFSWHKSAPGADAVSAAQAAYREIARMVQDRGLTIVHERLFGSLTARAGGPGRPERSPRRRQPFPCDSPELHPGTSPLGPGPGRGHHPGRGLPPAPG